jgi:hypothetical protein
VNRGGAGNPGAPAFLMEIHKTVLAGAGGIVAMLTIEQFNRIVGAIIGVLTVLHLSILIFKSLRKK